MLDISVDGYSIRLCRFWPYFNLSLFINEIASEFSENKIKRKKSAFVALKIIGRRPLGGGGASNKQVLGTLYMLKATL